MVLLRRSVRKIQFVVANIKNSLWTEPLNFGLFRPSKIFPTVYGKNTLRASHSFQFLRGSLYIDVATLISKQYDSYGKLDVQKIWCDY